ncbi:hypothetical protein AB0H71_16655 [Nocardia sp. NPDC050697]|uniref:hypothetical protein n=1 Tax=Nocardia sp. NPDC050697 TaxID=3155158 RepID=UPI0034070EC4
MSMSILEQVTDSYNRKARFLPAVLVVLPIIILGVAAVPVVVETWTKVAALAAFCLPFLASQIIRDRGLRVEEALFADWGGRPTETMLRWRANATTTAVQRRHDLILRHFSIALPTSAAEAAAPDEADESYSAAVSALRERTRDKSRFPLVFEENISYGFWRNTYASRGVAIAISLLAAIGTALLAYFSVVPIAANLVPALVAFDLVVAGGWGLLCTRDSVHRAAKKYALQLFASLELLGEGPSSNSSETSAQS